MSLNRTDGHSELLEDFLSDVVLYGAAVVTEYKLMRWTESKRITSKMWKRIHQVFDAVIEAADEHHSGYKLYVGEGGSTYSFLIWDRGEGEGKEADAWWKSIESLEQPKSRTRAASVIDAELETADA